MKKIQSLLILPLLFGCTGDDKETGMEEAFAPTEGSWSFSDAEYPSDECNMNGNVATSPDIVNALVFTLENTSGSEYTLSNAAGLSFDCTLTDMAFNCSGGSENELESYSDADGNEVVDEDGNPIDPEATTSINFSVVVTFSDADTASMVADYTGSCDGADCETVLSGLGITANPCASQLTANLAAE